MLIVYKKPTRGRFFVVGGKAQPVVEWTVTVTAGANGSVSVDGVSGNYSATVPDGTVLTLSATASEHYAFTQWSDGNTDNPRTITVTSDIALSSENDPLSYHVRIRTNGNGSVSVDGTVGDYDDYCSYGTSLALEALPATDYSFDSWSDGNTSTTRTVTVTGDIVLAASFQEETQYYSVNIYSSGPFTIVVDGVEGDYYESVAEGTELSVEAIIEEGSIFDSWSDGNTDNPRTLTVDGQIELTAYCHEDEYVEPTYLTVNGVQGEGTVSIDGGEPDYSVTEEVIPEDCRSIEAFPEEGYEFVEWTTQGQVSVNDPTENPTYACSGNEDGATNIVNAVFQQVEEDFNVDIHAGANGSVSVDGVPGDYLETVPGGTVLDIEALPDTDYEFTQWSDGNTDNPRTLTVDSDIYLGASFQQAAPQFKHFYVKDLSGSANTLTLTAGTESYTPVVSVSVSTDMANWSGPTEITTGGITFTVPADGKLYLKATANRWSGSSSGRNRGHWISCSGRYAVGGCINSLLFGDNYQNSALTTNNSTCFAYLFSDSINLVDASDLIMSATVANNCYRNMFEGCTSLTTAPELPATTLVSSCYNGMFQGCTSLTTAPELPATTLVSSCYRNMFYNCRNVSEITIYADDISANYCLTTWLYGVASTGTFHNLGSASYPSGANGIPSGWTEVHS